MSCCNATGLCSFTCPLRLGLQDNHKSIYIQQLRPTQTLQPRLKLKMFGHSGAGKSALVESLKCGILRSFFRRRRTRLTNPVRHPASPVTSKPAGRATWFPFEFNTPMMLCVNYNSKTLSTCTVHGYFYE